MSEPHRAGAQETLLCPSAPATNDGARVIGVVEGTPCAPSVTFLAMPVRVTPELLASVAPVSAGEVLRVAAPCAAQGCAHFARGACSLVERIVDGLPVVTEDLPACGIRSSCRWFAQEGAAACGRCPAVVTDNPLPTPEFAAAAAVFSAQA